MGERRWVRMVVPFMLMTLISGAALSREPTQEHGTVGMHGSIIDTPCAIAGDDIEQTVGIGTATTGDILHDGLGPRRIFHIHLIGCALKVHTRGEPNLGWFQVTFDGIADDGLFGVSGANGVSLQITDQDGHIAHPGLPLPGVALMPGEQALEYTLRLVGDHHALRAGDYRSTVKFKVDYF